MRLIRLFRHHGTFAIVDDIDYEPLCRFRWTLCNGYVRRWCNGGYLWLQHEVAMLAGMTIPPGFELDHVDRLPLNNQRSNLRVVSHSQNNYNRSYYLRQFEPYVTPD